MFPGVDDGDPKPIKAGRGQGDQKNGGEDPAAVD